MTEIAALDVRIPAEIIHNWGWFLVFGIGLLLLGILAVVRAVAATVVSMLFFGWLLVIAAGIEVVQAIMVGKWAGLYHHWLAAVLFGVVGALIVWRPVASAEVLTLLMGASVRGFAAGLGLARAQWPDHVAARYPGAGAMAGLGPVGDRPIRRNRADLCRGRLDGAGARPALVGLDLMASAAGQGACRDSIAETRRRS